MMPDMDRGPAAFVCPGVKPPVPILKVGRRTSIRTTSEAPASGRTFRQPRSSRSGVWSELSWSVTMQQ
jgi:hypothetical protein